MGSTLPFILCIIIMSIYFSIRYLSVIILWQYNNIPCQISGQKKIKYSKVDCSEHNLNNETAIWPGAIKMHDLRERKLREIIWWPQVKKFDTKVQQKNKKKITP